MAINKTLSEIQDAFMFVNMGAYGEFTALFDKKTGNIYLQSDLIDLDEYEDQQLAEGDYNEDIHIEIPHKNDLGLGRTVVFDFVEQFLPEDKAKVEQFFSKAGAYLRYKALLDSKGLLDKWYDFENERELMALSLWCKENEIVI